MIIHIPLETPSKKNSRVVDRRTGRSFPSKRYTEWHRNAALWVKTHHDLKQMGSGPFVIYFEFVHGDLRRRDGDNGRTSLLDLLVDLRIIDDDNWLVVRNSHETHLYDKGNPGVTISIIPLQTIDLTSGKELSKL